MKASARIPVLSCSDLVSLLQPGFFPALGLMVGQVRCWGKCSILASLRQSSAGAGCYTVVRKGWNRNGGKRKEGDLSGAVTLIHFPTSWSLLKCQTYLKFPVSTLSMVCASSFFFFLYNSYHHLIYSICYVFILLSFFFPSEWRLLESGDISHQNSIWYIHVLNICRMNTWLSHFLCLALFPLPEICKIKKGRIQTK